MQSFMPGSSTPALDRGANVAPSGEIASRPQAPQGADCEERKDLATSPEECERLLRAMFEQAPVGIVLIGLDGRWLGVNQRLCDILGYSSQELTARSWRDHAPPDDLVDLIDLSSVGRLQAGDLDTYDVDKRCIRNDGASVWVHVTASLVQAPEGKAAYVIAMVEDITDHRRLEHGRARLLRREQAARAEAETAREGSLRLEEILATAAHDLRTPLTATVGYIDLAERQTERLASMVRQSCPDLSRRSRGGTPARRGGSPKRGALVAAAGPAL